MRDATETRVFLALVAGSVGVGICVYQHHFTLEWSAASLATMLTHRCGMVMAAAIAWVVVEVSYFFLRELVRAGLRRFWLRQSDGSGRVV